MTEPVALPGKVPEWPGNARPARLLLRRDRRCLV